MNEKVRIALSDDHPIVLEGLRNLIRVENDFDLVGEATTGLAALKLIRDMRPDVAVIDISMPEMNGIVLSRRLAEECASVRILVLTSHEEQAYAKQALDCGVRGYVLKRSAAENLVPAIRAVLAGGLYVDPAIANRMFNANPRRGSGSQRDFKASGLTDREAEVLRLVALGFANKEVSRQLGVGVKSVETFKARGIEKLGLKTRADLVRYASAQGWFAGV
jgi:DNA-binding NarL/FixJ family response regulator